MMLEHNTYREAISDVKLPDDVGMEIMEGAIRRKEQRTQKLRARAIAAIAAPSLSPLAQTASAMRRPG